MILGFDLSTSVCGICILTKDGSIEYLDYYKFKSDNLIEKGNELNNLINELFEKYPISNYFVEERLEAFQQGKTTASTIGKLAAINFLSQYIINGKGAKYAAINVNHARGLVFAGFHKIARSIKDKKQKDIVFEMVLKTIGEHRFPKETKKRGKFKGQEVFVDEANDMADAWVIAKAGFIKVNSK